MTDSDPIRRPVAECTAEQVAEAFMRGFEGYIVPVAVTAQGYERRFRGEGLDAFASRLYVGPDGRADAMLLVTRRGWTSRVGAVGVAASARGKGLGRRVMEEAVRDARERGDRALLLEVFEENAPAVALYRSLGFVPMRRLVGWRRPADAAPPADDGRRPALAPAEEEALVEVDPLEVARAVAAEGDRAALPWQLAAETLANATAPARGFRLGAHAWALVPDASAETLVLMALVVSRAERRRGWGTRMVRALTAAFPGRPWHVHPVVPEELAPGFFSSLGWEPLPLAQLDMRLDLSSGG